jgi:hypothetical protein
VTDRSKALLDHVQGNHIATQGAEYPSNITRSTIGFHAYDNMVCSLSSCPNARSLGFR